MELKYYNNIYYKFSELLLIVPYGIEIIVRSKRLISAQKLLIVPYGIEIV